MNHVTLIGRLVRDPEIHLGPASVSRYTLAVDRVKKGEADFISCVAFGKSAEFAEKYLHKGMKIAVQGRIQTGKYTAKDGTTRYTTDVIVENHEFVESKNAAADKPLPNVNQAPPGAFTPLNDNVNYPGGIV